MSYWKTENEGYGESKGLARQCLRGGAIQRCQLVDDKFAWATAMSVTYLRHKGMRRKFHVERRHCQQKFHVSNENGACPRMSRAWKLAVDDIDWQ
jgi:hypothetical protein